eukprot:3355992-Rhodomonas_salina.1
MSPIVLRNCYAMSGTEKQYAATSCYALFCTDLGYAATRQTVPAIAAISQMAAGDGVADIVGRKFGTVKWPWYCPRNQYNVHARASAHALCASSVIFSYLFCPGYAALVLMRAYLLRAVQ